MTDPGFYRDLLKYLGFKTIATYVNGFGATDGVVSLWVFKVQEKFNTRSFHRKSIGLNHIAFRVGSKEAVDAFYTEYLLENKLPVLYGGPAPHLEYVRGYYAVYLKTLTELN